MHVVEGQYGSVQAFVVPQTCPRVCKAAVHTIKPLCMHHRLNSWEGTVPMNELQITGDNQTLLASSFPCRQGCNPLLVGVLSFLQLLTLWV